MSNTENPTMQKLKVTTKEQLRKIIEESSIDADLNYLDVSV